MLAALRDSILSIVTRSCRNCAEPQTVRQKLLQGSKQQYTMEWRMPCQGSKEELQLRHANFRVVGYKHVMNCFQLTAKGLGVIKLKLNMLKTFSVGADTQLVSKLRNRVITARQQLHQPWATTAPQFLRSVSAAATSDGGKTAKPLPDDHAALLSIRNALQDGRRPIVCQGAVQLDSPVGVYGQTQADQLFSVQLPPADDTVLQQLLDACVPAVFGRGPDEVHTEDMSSTRLGSSP